LLSEQFDLSVVTEKETKYFHDIVYSLYLNTQSTLNFTCLDLI